MVLLSYTGIMVLLLTLQALGFPLAYHLGGALPNMGLLLIIFVSLSRGSFFGLFLGTFAGWYLDVNSFLPFGFHIIIFSTIGFFLGKIRDAFSLDRFFGPFLVSLAVAILVNLFAIILNAIFSLEILPSIFSMTTLLEIVYSAIMGPVFFAITNFFEKIFKRRPGGQYL